MPRWDVHFDLHIDLSDSRMVRLVERAHALAAVITETPIPPYLQSRLDAVNIMRAVRGTTAIEGAEVSFQEVQKILESPDSQVLPASRGKDEQEVRNAQNAMHHIVRLLKQHPDCSLTEPIICDLHRLMTENIDYERNVPGHYRNHPVTARDYVPPEIGDEVKGLMQRFVEWLNTPPTVNWDPIIRALAAHFYLTSIHPFGDGNGRTSRAIESFLLYQGKVNARGFYSLSNYYYQNREQYVQQLDNARFNGDKSLTPFIMFALRGLAEELQEVHQDVLNEVKVISFRDLARELFLTHERLGTKAGVRGFQFLLSMGREPIALSDVYGHQLYKDVTKRTVQRDLKFLRDHELVIIQKGQMRINVDVMSQFTANEEIERNAIEIEHLTAVETS